MEQNRYASSAEACNLLLGLLIVAQFPIMFGAASPNAVIQVIPWVITAYPMIIITVVLMYRHLEDAKLQGGVYGRRQLVF